MASPILEFWRTRRVLVTGGRGFLGRAVLDRLSARAAPARWWRPTSADYDLRDRRRRHRLFADVEPDLVIHLAARVGGIGANHGAPRRPLPRQPADGHLRARARPAAASTPKTVMVGTICSYPKFTPVPFREDSLWQGYPEETNAPYGIAKLAQLVQAQANRAQYGQNVVYLMPTNLYGPGDKFHPAVSHVIPALIKKCVDAKEAGADHIEVWGTGSAPAASSSTSTTPPRASCWPPSATTTASRSTSAPTRSCPIRDLVELIVEARRLRGRDPLGHLQARRPAPPAGRRQPGRAQRFGFKAEHARSTRACAAPSTGTSPTATRPRPATV